LLKWNTSTCSLPRWGHLHLCAQSRDCYLSVRVLHMETDLPHEVAVAHDPQSLDYALIKGHKGNFFTHQMQHMHHKFGDRITH